ncbi:phage baseplate assembly protein V [Allokutzneria sp. A3M-2-11 16]|uniref:phage baseplate assembly protein V n=1 Tax=Allokutzneria sp. A3M-2-11 16 TaxID=2962043 RepID=UPI0020B8D794|nr:phage baseplate assembly protein V [Allokutzneria sp. A3M-2-11 16]MCP3804191.1 phage baseplate assembly protein V [Allokutzneria sp. A3M-2-11 16]
MTEMSTGGNDLQQKKYYGRYKGVVRSNFDPLDQGRLLVAVPEVLGNDPCIWASPSTPLSTLGGGGAYMRALEGAGVLVEFLDGNLDYPMWTGFWRGTFADTPAAVKTANPKASVIVLATSAKNSLVIDDTPGVGGITLKVGASEISVTEQGIKLRCGGSSIELLPTGQVSVNGPALTVL